MNCPRCNADSFVTETRAVPAGLRRRRQCDYCGHRFSTVEQIVPERARYNEPMAFVPKAALDAAIAGLRALTSEGE